MVKINNRINRTEKCQNLFSRSYSSELKEYKAVFRMLSVLTVVLFIIPLAPVSAVNTKTSKIFLLGGQSNMLGRKKVKKLKSPYDVPFQQVRMWNNSTKDWEPLHERGVSSKERFGPEASFGHAIAEILPGEDIRLVKYAASGTALYNDWSPKMKGKQYQEFMNTVKAALSELKTSGTNYEVAGMMWLQGESDAHEGKADAYAKNLTEFIIHLRTQFKTPKMPFVIARVRSYYGGKNGQAKIVRAAQVKVAESAGNAAWFNTDDCSMFNKGHYDMNGLIKIGKRFAEKYKEIIRKHNR
jgi:hypothetical protein